MKRVLLPTIPAEGETIQPPEQERRHLQNVRRVSVGEQIEVLDGKGSLAIAEICGLARNSLQLRILEHRKEERESPLHLELAVAIPSHLATFDDMLPSLVQLGVTQLYLVPTQWGGRLKKAKYAQRLNTIAQQALKQCGRLQAPSLDFPTDWATLCEHMARVNPHNTVYHPNKPGGVPAQHEHRLGLLIGPEAGFTEVEVEQAMEHGMQVCGLGPRILKMETAAIGACYLAQFNNGDLG